MLYDQAYFDARVSPEPNAGCWLWTGTCDARGYGRTGKSGKAHRLSYQLHKGDPSGLSVCHRCDMPACVNPAHLFLGTQRDNMRDMFTKGRNFIGRRNSSNCSGRLTASDLISIREAAARGALHRDLAVRYGVTRPHISKVVAGVRGLV